MKTWYQIYKGSFWYTSTTDKEEARKLADELRRQGYQTEIKIK